VLAHQWGRAVYYGRTRAQAFDLQRVVTAYPRLLGTALLRWFVRQLRSMPNSHDPYSLSFTTIEEAIRRNDHLTVG
jgi:hypothetical protein